MDRNSAGSTMVPVIGESKMSWMENRQIETPINVIDEGKGADKLANRLTKGPSVN